MAKARSHTHAHPTKRHGSSHSAGSAGQSQHKTQESQVLPIRSGTEENIGIESQEDTPFFLAWPSHLFEMMLVPWRALTPMEAWIENLRTGGKSVFPKTGTKETDNEYIYMVQLPGIVHEQLSLGFQNGMIMLSIREPDKGRTDYNQPRFVRRAFSLPVYTHGAAITAELKNGVLTITIPKTDKPVAPKSHMIKIT